MTGNGAKIWTGNQKSPVNVRRRNARMLALCIIDRLASRSRRCGVEWQIPNDNLLCC
jgi:hypothetical protein